MHEYGTFAKYHTVQEAEPLLELFRQNKIEYNIYQERNQLDAVFIGDGMDPMIVVSIPINQFTRANELTREEFSKENITGEPNTDDILTKEFIPEKLPTEWIVIGYILGFFVIVGIFCGLTLMNSYKRLPDGTKMKMFDHQTIKHGKIILVIATLNTIFWFARKFEVWSLF